MCVSACWLWNSRASKEAGLNTGVIEVGVADVWRRVGVTVMVGESPTTVWMIVTGGRPRLVGL